MDLSSPLLSSIKVIWPDGITRRSGTWIVLSSSDRMLQVTAKAYSNPPSITSSAILDERWCLRTPTCQQLPRWRLGLHGDVDGMPGPPRRRLPARALALKVGIRATFLTRRRKKWAGADAVRLCWGQNDNLLADNLGPAQSYALGIMREASVTQKRGACGGMCLESAPADQTCK